jgi:hypothetical protein
VSHPNPTTDPAETDRMLGQVAAATARIRAGDTMPPRETLAALGALRQLRASLDAWEPTLIAAARTSGVSWAELAPVLGVASRQAAERRFLRQRQSDHDRAGMTGDQRVLAERDRRAGERAVIAWARQHGADLRQLAGQITALTDLAPDARPSLDRLHNALGGKDAAVLVSLLAETRRHLPTGHAALAERVNAVTTQVDQVRQRTHQRRANDRADQP